MSVTAVRRRSFALVALSVMSTAAPLVADSAKSQFNVTVTVVRSCVVDVQPVVGGAPRLRLDCATGAARDVRVIESTSTAAPLPSGTSSGDLRLVFVNF
jgi:hypothetical protein